MTLKHWARQTTPDPRPRKLKRLQFHRMPHESSLALALTNLTRQLVESTFLDPQLRCDDLIFRSSRPSDSRLLISDRSIPIKD